MKAIIRIDVPEYQIGQEVSCYFKDTMNVKGICEAERTGHWYKWYEEIKRDDKCTDYIPHCKCSECNKEYDAHIIQFINFCPNCGADMRGDNNDKH